jgi:YidC/Oxa1 family membrane protein insertase
MTDIRRTLLWVVFTMSLVLLWDAWNKHTGQPTLFGGNPKPTAAAGAAPGVPASVPAVGVPAPAAVPNAAATAPGPASAVPTVTAPPSSEQVTITTDLVKATLDSQGGSLIRLELLAHRDALDQRNNVVLLEQSAKRLYVAQTGLITSQAGWRCPTT